MAFKMKEVHVKFLGVPSKKFMDKFVKQARGTGSLLDKVTHTHAPPVRQKEKFNY